MIKKLFLFLCLCGSAWAQSTTTITGNLKNLGTGSVSTGSFVRFYLRGCAGNLPRINGTAIIAPTLGNVYYFDFVPNSSGAISGSLYSTRDATGNGNGAIECGGSLTAVWYGYVPFLNGKAGPETPVHAKASATLDISNITPITTNPVSTAPTGDTTYCRLDGGNCDLNTNSHSLSTTTGTFSGLLTANQANINGTFACPTSGANFSANLTAGLALIPASGGYLDCRNLNGNQSMAADVTFTGPVTVFLGNMQLSGTGRFIVPQSLGNANVFLIGIPAYPIAASGTTFTYSGTDWPVKVGSSAGVTTRFGMSYINLTLGASALGGVLNNRTQFTRYDNITITGISGANTQICFNSDGTGGFNADMQMINGIITQCHTAVQMTGPVSGNNANQFLGGTFQASGKADTGSIAFNIVTGDTNLILGVDLEAADIGVQFGANATHNTLAEIRMEGATINTHAKFLNGATYNKVRSPLQIGSGGVFVVSNAAGLTNSVDLNGWLGSDGTNNNNIYQLNASDASQFYTFIAGLTADQIEGLRFFDHTQSAQASFYQDASKNVILDTGNGTTHHFAARPGVSTDINAPATFPVRIGVSSGNGVTQHWNSTQAFHTDITAPAVNAVVPVTLVATTSTTAPTITAAGCGGSAASIVANNGTVAFELNVGTAPTSGGCSVTMPAATTGWNCDCSDLTTTSTSVFYCKQTGAVSTTTVVLQNFSDVAAATAFTASDHLRVKCMAY